MINSPAKQVIKSFAPLPQSSVKDSGMWGDCEDIPTKSLKDNSSDMISADKSILVKPESSQLAFEAAKSRSYSDTSGVLEEEENKRHSNGFSEIKTVHESEKPLSKSESFDKIDR